MGRVTSLIVQTKTGSTQWSDSVDLVYFDIGNRQWLLRNPSTNPNHRDFATGQISTFHLQSLGNLDTAQIRKIRFPNFFWYFDFLDFHMRAGWMRNYMTPTNLGEIIWLALNIFGSGVVGYPFYGQTV